MLTDPRAFAAHLLARETAAGADSAAIGAAIQKVFTRVSENLRRSVGVDGYSALLERALARTHAAHPLLTEIRRLDETGIQMDGVVATVETHGVRPVAAAIQSLLETLIDILSGLIGEDMVLNLLDDGPQHLETPTAGNPK